MLYGLGVLVTMAQIGQEVWGLRYLSQSQKSVSWLVLLPPLSPLPPLLNIQCIHSSISMSSQYVLNIPWCVGMWVIFLNKLEGVDLLVGKSAQQTLPVWTPTLGKLCIIWKNISHIIFNHLISKSSWIRNMLILCHLFMSFCASFYQLGCATVFIKRITSFKIHLTNYTYICRAGPGKASGSANWAKPCWW